MFDDSEHTTVRTMTPQSSFAPFTISAPQIDFADNPPAKQPRIVSLDHFANKFVSRCARKVEVTTSEFQIRIADAAQEQTDHSESRRSLRTPSVTNGDTSLFQMDCKHEGILA